MPDSDRSAWYERMREKYRESPVHALMGLELRDIEHGAVTVALHSKGELRNAMGVMHGGAISTAVDSALLQSVRSTLGEGDGITTVELKVNFLAPAAGTTFTCRGTALRVGKSVGVAEAKLFNDKGGVVAAGLGTLAIRRQA